MKKKHLKIVLFFVFCACVMTALYISLDKDIENSVRENPYTPQFDYYTVTEYQGKIAVFKNADTIPIDVYDSYISHLPEHDRQLLKKGIRTESTQELQKIIEDYTS